MKNFTIPSSSGESAYPLRVWKCDDETFQIVQAYAFRNGRRHFQDFVCEVPSRELAEFVCASLNQADKQAVLVAAAQVVVDSWSSGDLAQAVNDLEQAVLGLVEGGK